MKSIIALTAVVLSVIASTATAAPSPKPLFPASSSAPKAKRQGAAVYYSCTQPNDVALTFDDGPWRMTDISNQLLAVGGKATFFLNGNNWSCIYDDDKIAMVKNAYDAGHQIGSHTWSHSDLATLTWDQLHDEMWRVELALQRIIGAQPAFMRPPFGSFNQMVQDVAQIRGQSLAIWDFDDGDSIGATPEQSKADYDAIVNSHPNSILSLNHETYDSTVDDVLPHAISILKAAGYNLVTVAECLGQAPYQWVGTPQTKASDWTC